MVMDTVPPWRQCVTWSPPVCVVVVRVCCWPHLVLSAFVAVRICLQQHQLALAHSSCQRSRCLSPTPPIFTNRTVPRWSACLRSQSSINRARRLRNKRLPLGTAWPHRLKTTRTRPTYGPCCSILCAKGRKKGGNDKREKWDKLVCTAAVVSLLFTIKLTSKRSLPQHSLSNEPEKREKEIEREWERRERERNESDEREEGERLVRRQW